MNRSEKTMRPHALVTGATSGIGYAVARGLLGEGYAVFLTGRNGKKLADMVEEATGKGEHARSLSADLSRVEEVARLIETVTGSFDSRLDLLVNNAGAVTIGPVEEITRSDYDHLMAVNVRAPFLLSQAFLPMMKKNGGGLIVNISSVAGLDSWAGSSLYSMTKFALRGLTGSLMAEGASHGVKAVAICPGYVATPLVAGAPVPPQEMIQPGDILHTIRYLRDLSPYAVSGDIVLRRRGEL